LAHEEFTRFVEVTKRLRKECPWDKEQTHASIRHSLIEETYEVVESIDDQNWDELKKELGDLLLHVVFHANIAEEQNEFTLKEVIDGISEKLIRRHPHIYGTDKRDDVGEILQHWEKLKMKEGRESLLDGVPKELPALLRAHRLTERASKVGFDWKNYQCQSGNRSPIDDRKIHQTVSLHREKTKRDGKRYSFFEPGRDGWIVE